MADMRNWDHFFILRDLPSIFLLRIHNFFTKTYLEKPWIFSKLYLKISYFRIRIALNQIFTASSCFLRLWLINFAVNPSPSLWIHSNFKLFEIGQNASSYMAWVRKIDGFFIGRLEVLRLWQNFKIPNNQKLVLNLSRKIQKNLQIGSSSLASIVYFDKKSICY